jgi:hypothetical protein
MDADLTEFVALQALVSELRGRLPANLTEREYADVGMWMLKALWLGQGQPLNVVFETVTHDQRPRLRLV